MVNSKNPYIVQTPFGRYEESRSTARYHHLSRDRMYPSFVILQYTHRGYGIFEIDGTKHSVPEGHAFITIVPEEASYWFPKGSPDVWVFSWINFFGEFGINLWSHFRQAFGPVVPLKPQSEAFILFRSLIRSVEKKQLTSDYHTSSMVFEFYMKWVSQLTKTTLDDAGIENVIAYINHQFFEPVTIKELASRAELSREHLTRVFKQKKGISPADYLRRRRLEASERLLLKSKYSIQEIGSACGFFSAKHFNQAFTHHYHLSPLHYRKKHSRRK